MVKRGIKLTESSPSSSSEPSFFSSSFSSPSSNSYNQIKYKVHTSNLAMLRVLHYNQHWPMCLFCLLYNLPYPLDHCRLAHLVPAAHIYLLMCHLCGCVYHDYYKKRSEHTLLLSSSPSSS